MLEQQTPTDTLSQLVGALILELADNMPDSAGLETVKSDRLAASRTYEAGTKQDLALRFYLATRYLLHEVTRTRQKEAPKVFSEAAGTQAEGVIHHELGSHREAVLNERLISETPSN